MRVRMRVAVYTKFHFIKIRISDYHSLTSATTMQSVAIDRAPTPARDHLLSNFNPVATM
jgi:hypothetical protein